MELLPFFVLLPIAIFVIACAMGLLFEVLDKMFDRLRERQRCRLRDWVRSDAASYLECPKEKFDVERLRKSAANMKPAVFDSEGRFWEYN